MQTDEYEISITREIKICKYHIEEIKKKIKEFEEKYSTSTDDIINQKQDFINIKDSEKNKWKVLYNSLKDWEYKLSEYQKAYNEFRKKD